MTDFRAPAALDFRRIGVAFPARRRDAAAFVALHDVSLAVAPGEFVAIVGPSGSGKSTLLNVAAGLQVPDTGEVRVFGERLAGINRRAGYLFQGETLLPWKSALDNVTFGLQLHGQAKTASQALGRAWLAKVGLADAADRYPHELSGGMRKRVALAQMLVLDPEIALMDEPFSSLDAQTQRLMEQELLALWQADRKSVLFVTHDLEQAIALSDRVVVLSLGPASHPLGEFPIALARPRDSAEIRRTPAFVGLHEEIWRTLRDEVLRGHARRSV